MDSPDLQVKKVGVLIPVSVEQLLDAGHNISPEMAAGLRPPVRLPWHVRWRMALGWSLWSLRRRVGFWIADYEPDDEDW